MHSCLFPENHKNINTSNLLKYSKNLPMDTQKAINAIFLLEESGMLCRIPTAAE
jgi:hypothetical protein